VTLVRSERPKPILREPSMNHPISYHQNCPVCGRSLRIGVRLLGRRVYCQHCGGGFIATEVADGRKAARRNATPQLDAVDALIERAEMLLERGDTNRMS